jgi:hypothetical protein
VRVKIIELPRIEENKKYYDALEKRLKEFFRIHLYYPLLKELNLPKNTITNAKPNPLQDALFSGKVFYSQGAFRGKFNAAISKELKQMGAKFDRKTSSFKLPELELPSDTHQLILASQSHFNEKMKQIDKKLSTILPEQIADQFHCADIFDQAIWKADKSFKENVKKITVSPEIPKDQRERISTEWQDNMRLNIKGWTEEQIKDLRKTIYDDVILGARKESFIPPILKITKTIEASHDQAINKAKFLAHQETRLLMGTLKQAKYESVGSRSYIWRCVHRPHDVSPTKHTEGNVRYTHGLLNGKEIKWSEPPITSNPGEPVRRNHAGMDYNCRCFSRPLIRAKSGPS